MRHPGVKQLAAPPWTNTEIVAAAARLSDRYEQLVGREYILKNGLHFDDVYEKLIYPQFKIELYEDEELGTDGKGHKVLGVYDVRNNVAMLDVVISRESDDPRRTFTCWHEVFGHGVLHGNWLRKQLIRRQGPEFINVTEFSVSAMTEQRLERQANLFAAHMAAPEWLVNYAIKKILRPTRRFLYREPGKYWLDVQGLRMPKFVVDAGDLSGWIGSKISGYFGGLSGEALGHRITELGWIDDRTQVDLHLHRATRQMVGASTGLSGS